MLHLDPLQKEEEFNKQRGGSSEKSLKETIPKHLFTTQEIQAKKLKKGFENPTANLENRGYRARSARSYREGTNFDVKTRPLKA